MKILKSQFWGVLWIGFLSINSCTTDKCGGVQNRYIPVTSHAGYYFKEGDLMVFKNENGVSDSAYWGKVQTYYAENQGECIGPRMTCCAREHHENIYITIGYKSGDKGRPVKIENMTPYDSKGNFMFSLDFTNDTLYYFNGNRLKDVSYMLDKTMDTVYVYSSSKGFLKINLDTAKSKRWERIF